jgi:ABC-2 type transport system ATP-binding protein
VSTDVIRAEGVVKAFGSTRALDGLDLTVSPGQVYGFLGPNGAGKSTTIRMLVDLVRPTEGYIRVLGLDPHYDGVRLRRRIGYLPGAFAVDGRRTGRQVLAYLASLRGGVSVRRIGDLSARLDLDLDRPVRSLSRGNQQKVGLVQAFMHAPELVILDEPTNGLDPLLRHEFAEIVRESAASGATVFMSSHVMSEVQETADRVGILRSGRLVRDVDVQGLTHGTQRSVAVLFATPAPAELLAGIPGVSEVRSDGNRTTLQVRGSMDPLVKRLASVDVDSLVVREPSVEDLFFDAERGRSAHA